MSFGLPLEMGKHFRYLAIHETAYNLGPSKSRGLLFFHAFTGCYQISAFTSKEKKTARETWLSYGEISPIFEMLSRMPLSLDEVSNLMQELERFVMLMYDKTNESLRVNAARKDILTRKGLAIDNISPSELALIEHTKRAVIQASYCWGQCLVPSPGDVSPGDCEWQ